MTQVNHSNAKKRKRKRKREASDGYSYIIAEAEKRQKMYVVKRSEEYSLKAKEMHTNDALQLLKESAARGEGEGSVPVDEIVEARNRNTAFMRYYNDLILESGGRNYKIQGP